MKKKLNEREIKKITELYNDLLRSINTYSKLKSSNSKINMLYTYTLFSQYYYKMGVPDPILCMYVPFTIFNIYS